MTSKRFAPSPYQQAIFDWVKDGSGSAIVTAVAGSGKTTTLINALKYVEPGRTVKFLAFNSLIVAELKEKIENARQEALDNGERFAKVEASTFHSVGFSALRKHLNLTDKDKPTSGKLEKILAARLPEWEQEIYSDFCSKLVDLARGEGFGAIVDEDAYRWRSLIDHHDLMLDDEEASVDRAIEIARKLLKASTRAAIENKVFDFNDMLYIPLILNLKLYQFDWVFVDEAQDTNPVRRELAKRILKRTGRLVAVGDNRQAIYGFTGASHDALDLIRDEFRAIELPLTISYRCSKAVVRAAQSIVPYIEASETAPEGAVEVKRWKDTLPLLGPRDAILCRTVAPLVQTFYSLMAAGVPATLIGKDIGAELIKIIGKMRARTIDTLSERLIAWKTRELRKAIDAGEDSRVDKVCDQFEAILVSIDGLSETERTVGGLIKKLESIFSDDARDVLTLCSAHKSKGREWDQVAIIRPDLMPLQSAKKEWQVVQESNLLYVAITRAKERLIYVER